MINLNTLKDGLKVKRATLSNLDEDKESLLFFSGALALVLIAFALFRITEAPENERAEELDEQIESSHISIFTAATRHSILPDFENANIEDQEKEAQRLRDDAQLMWNAIDVAETIYKRTGGGQWHPVGDNKDVVSLRSEAEKIDIAVQLDKIRLAKEHGKLLLDTSDASIWNTRNERIEMLENLHKRNSWYYDKGVLYLLVSALHVLCVIILFVGGPITILLSFSAASAFFNFFADEE